MKKRRVLHQACAFSVAVMLVGVNAVPVVAADNNSSATTVATDEKAFNITVTFNYRDYAVGADGQYFLTKTSQLQSIPKRQKIDIFLLGFET